MINTFIKYIKQGDARSVNTKLNVLYSFIIKGISIVITLFFVPLTLDFLTPLQYGLWLTFSTFLAWISLFDIGFGNGLRNKLSEAITKKKYKLAKIYISTTYTVLALLLIFISVVFFLFNQKLSWAKILNGPVYMENELGAIAIIVFSTFCVQFFLQIINTVFTANQKPAVSSLINLISNILSLVAILIVSRYGKGNLILFALIMGVIPIIVLIITSIIVYNGKYKQFSPSIKYIRYKYTKDLMGLGIKFFIIQIGALVLFQTDNIILSQLFGPEEVTTFNIAFKLFSVITMCFLIIVTPLWSAYTSAYAIKDFDWIKRVVKKLHKLWILILGTAIALLFLSPYIYRIWLGDSVHIPYSLTVAMTFYIIVYTWQTIHVFLLNGIGVILLQLFLVIFTSLINIPLSIYLCNNFGVAGVTIASTLLFGFMGILFSIQCKKILNGDATGIWAK